MTGLWQQNGAREWNQHDWVTSVKSQLCLQSVLMERSFFPMQILCQSKTDCSHPKCKFPIFFTLWITGKWTNLPPVLWEDKFFVYIRKVRECPITAGCWSWWTTSLVKQLPHSLKGRGATHFGGYDSSWNNILITALSTNKAAKEKDITSGMWVKLRSWCNLLQW